MRVSPSMSWCCYLSLQDLVQSCARGRRRIAKDMCYGRAVGRERTRTRETGRKRGGAGGGGKGESESE